MSAPGQPAASEGILEPSSVRVERTDRGTIDVQVGERHFEDVSVRRAFPLEMADAFIGLIGADGDEIGIIEDLQELDRASRAILEAELTRTYFLPLITRIGDLSEEYGTVQAEIETTSGARAIEIRGIRSSIRLLSRQRALIEDADGNRYELRDYHLLPKMTREILGL